MDAKQDPGKTISQSTAPKPVQTPTKPNVILTLSKRSAPEGE
jgi:hypothetical protein